MGMGNSSGMMGNDPYGVQDAGETKGKKGNSNSTLTPVTLRMIASATQDPDDSFIVNGRAIGKFVTYGLVRLKTDKSTSFTLLLDDGTSQMDATKWIDQDESSESQAQRESIVPGVYVCVYGIIKAFSGNRYISAIHVRIVSDMNEITHHLLDTLYVSLQITQGPPPRKAEAETSMQHQNTMYGNAQSNQMRGNGSVSTFNPYGAAPVSNNNNNSMGRNQANPYGSNMMQGPGDLNMHQKLVLQAFSNDGGSDMGLSVMEVAKILSKNGLKFDDVRRATDFLVQEGHIYSTVDDDHFKSTGDA